MKPDWAKRTLFEDRALLVVDKPAGIASTGRDPEDQSAVEGQLREIKGPLWSPHQLDKFTSGVLVFCKRKSAVRAINALFASRQIKKTYRALVEGALPKKTVCELPLDDKSARTRFQPDGTASESAWSWVIAHPDTGRTHQIRRHLAALGHPIVGDAQYGRAHDEVRLALHAAELRFESPQLGAHVFVAPLPEDLARFRLK